MFRTLFVFVIALLTACSPVNRYQKLPEVQAWENDIRNLEQRDQSEQYTANAILFAGSSSIRLWSSIAKDMMPYEVIQRGYGGAKLSDFIVYAHRIISPHPCSAIVLFIANDISGSEDDKSPRQVARLFSHVIDTIRKSHPTTPVFWIEITPTPLRWDVWKQACAANQLIKEACAEHKNVYFIETAFAFLNQNGLPKAEYFLPDRLHLNEEGYRIWSGLIRKKLDTVLFLNTGYEGAVVWDVQDLNL